MRAGDGEPVSGALADATHETSRPEPIARGRAYDLARGDRIPGHRHDQHQLLYASSGVMRVRVAAGEWIVPPHRAVWIPSRQEHAVAATVKVAMRTLYVEPAAAAAGGVGCRVVEVSPLLRELVLRAVQIGDLRPDDDRHVRCLAMIVDELQEIPAEPLHLPEPRDARARRIARAVLADPAEPTSLGEWGRRVGASERTLARRFVAETGMSFGAWRRQARLLRALEGLAEGRSVKLVAMDAGYASTSAFVTMFRRTLGATPRRYFSSGTGEADG